MNTRCSSLLLYGNKLSGTIPPYLGNLDNIMYAPVMHNECLRVLFLNGIDSVCAALWT